MCDFVADEAKAAANSAGNLKNFYCFLKKSSSAEAAEDDQKSFNSSSLSAVHNFSSAEFSLHSADLYSAMRAGALQFFACFCWRTADALRSHFCHASSNAANK